MAKANVTGKKMTVPKSKAKVTVTTTTTTTKSRTKTSQKRCPSCGKFM